MRHNAPAAITQEIWQPANGRDHHWDGVTHRLEHCQRQPLAARREREEVEGWQQHFDVIALTEEVDLVSDPEKTRRCFEVLSLRPITDEHQRHVVLSARDPGEAAQQEVDVLLGR